LIEILHFISGINLYLSVSIGVVEIIMCTAFCIILCTNINTFDTYWSSLVRSKTTTKNLLLFTKYKFVRIIFLHQQYWFHFIICTKYLIFVVIRISLNWNCIIIKHIHFKFVLRMITIFSKHNICSFIFILDTPSIKPQLLISILNSKFVLAHRILH